MKLGNQTCVSAKSELVLARGLDTCSATGGVGVEVLVAADGLSASSAPRAWEQSAAPTPSASRTSHYC